MDAEKQSTEQLAIAARIDAATLAKYVATADTLLRSCVNDQPKEAKP